MARRGGLGRGLDSIIPDKREKTETTATTATAATAATTATTAATTATADNTIITENQTNTTEENIDLSEKTTSKNENKDSVASEIAEKEGTTPNNGSTKTGENTATKAKTTKTTKITKTTKTSKTTPKSITKKSTETKSTETKETTAKPSNTKGSDSKSTMAVKTQKTDKTTNDGKKSTPANSEAALKKETSESAENVQNPQSEFLVKLSKIEPNRDQPRKEFNEDALQELAESIKNHGMIQPIVVRPKGKQYEIVSGERRWRAARLAGLKDVPVVIKEYSDSEVAEIALVENLQREDLSPIEEAIAYQKLLDDFGLKQEEIAFRVSKSRSVITNALRLLKLPETVRNMINEKTLSTGHGKVLLSLDDPKQQITLAQRIVDENLSVRQTEEAVRQLLNPPAPKKKTELSNEVIYKDLEKKLCQKISSKVSIHRSNEKKGKIEIAYTSLEDLERIVEQLGIQFE